MNSMRIFTAYLLDGRGQASSGRRTTTPSPAVMLDDDRHDADVGADDAIDAEWTEDGQHADPHEGEGADRVAAANDNEPVRRKPTARPDDSYLSYMATLRDLPRLDRDEEHRIAKKYQKTHDAKLAEQLINSNLKLVVK